MRKANFTSLWGCLFFLFQALLHWQGSYVQYSIEVREAFLALVSDFMGNVCSVLALAMFSVGFSDILYQVKEVSFY